MLCLVRWRVVNAAGRTTSEKCSGGIKLETMKGKGLLAAAMAFAAMGEMPTDVELNDNRPTPYSKTPLTKKQKKARVRAKIARKSRKINRR